MCATWTFHCCHTLLTLVPLRKKPSQAEDVYFQLLNLKPILDCALVVQGLNPALSAAETELSWYQYSVSPYRIFLLEIQLPPAPRGDKHISGHSAQEVTVRTVQADTAGCSTCLLAKPQSPDAVACSCATPWADQEKEPGGVLQKELCPFNL